MSERSGRAAARRRVMVESLCEWFGMFARDLPWRTVGGKGGRDPYQSLVAELMLQQTQVSRVVEKYPVFLARFPSVEELSKASEEDVLAAWSGLGYYRRARHLHAAAKAIVADHAGMVPPDAKSLRSLPGVGRYTAGALSSIVFGRHEPIVDGNVMRVLLRVEGKEMRFGEKESEEWAWEEAGALIAEMEDPGVFNEALMELGATVCIPGTPNCSVCPIEPLCLARARGQEREIPLAKRRFSRKKVFHTAVLVRDDANRLMVERRPDRGLWAGLYQAPTLEGLDRAAAPARLRAAFGVVGLKRCEEFLFLTTHREVHFRVYTGDGGDAPGAGLRWAAREEIERLPLATPHRRILLGSDSGSDSDNC